jgi:hypothetical protein
MIGVEKTEYGLQYVIDLGSRPILHGKINRDIDCEVVYVGTLLFCEIEKSYNCFISFSVAMFAQIALLLFHSTKLGRSAYSIGSRTPARWNA